MKGGKLAKRPLNGIPFEIIRQAASHVAGPRTRGPVPASRISVCLSVSVCLCPGQNLGLFDGFCNGAGDVHLPLVNMSFLHFLKCGGSVIIRWLRRRKPKENIGI